MVRLRQGYGPTARRFWGLASRCLPRVHGNVEEVRLRSLLRCKRRLEARGFEPLCAQSMFAVVRQSSFYLGKISLRILTNRLEQAQMFLVPFLPWQALR